MKHVGHTRLAVANVAAGIALAISVAASPLRAASLYYTGSALFGTGTYGLADRTSGGSLTNGLMLYARPLRISANVPAIGQSTPMISTTGTGFVPSGGSGSGSGPDGSDAAETSYESVYGIGDPVVRADLEALRMRGRLPAVQIFGQTKIPLADPADGLGTGEWDFAAGLSLAEGAGRFLILIESAYWMLGDTPDTDFENPVSLNVNVGRAFAGGKLMASAIYAACTEIVSGAEPPQQAGVGLNYFTSSGRAIGGTAMFGLSESTSDVSVSLGWTVPLR